MTQHRTCGCGLGAVLRRLVNDVDLFLRKSFIVNVYYERVIELYSPEPVSFNKCPAAMNNAGLAFDQTYTRHYPLMHDLYASLGGDTTALVMTLKRMLPQWPRSVTRAADLMKILP